MSQEIAWTWAMQDHGSELQPFERCHESPEAAKTDARAYVASLRRQGLPVGRTYLVRVERSLSYLPVGEIADVGQASEPDIAVARTEGRPDYARAVEEAFERKHVAKAGCDDCSVEPGETHRWVSCPGNQRDAKRAGLPLNGDNHG
jgi:hypothetical protein